jgi:hypothetical protein
MKIPCPLSKTAKKFKFQYIAGPFLPFTDAELAKKMAVNVANKENVVIADYRSFGYHEMDETLKKAWLNAQIGWDHPMLKGQGPDSKIAARSYFVCSKTESDKPYSFFEDQNDEYWKTIEKRG